MNFCCLYDKDFKALGKWTSHLCSSFKLVKRAYDYDELEVECQGFENSKDASYIILHDKYGNPLYCAFCGIPTTKKNLTKIKAIDCREIFNQDIYLDFSILDSDGSYKYKTLGDLYTYLLKDCLSDYNIGVSYEIDTLEASILEWDEEKISRTKAIRNVYEMIQAVNNLYNCIVVPEVGVESATGTYYLKFTVKRIVNTIPIKLSDYGAETSQNSNIINRIVCISGSQKQILYLQKDNTISSTYVEDNALLPPRIETIEKDTLEEAISDGYSKLADSMYKDRVKINLNTKNGERLKNVDLTYFADISEYNPADTNSVKRLPVYAISIDSSENKTIEFGRLSTYWFLD